MKKLNKLLSLLILGSIFIPTSAEAFTKQEVVFATLHSKGSVEESIVNNHLKYVPKENIEDETILKNILNISGDEKFTQDGNKLTFEGKGKDITYQGKLDKTLPVSVEINYYLDGKKMSQDEMLKKAGKVEIVINFTNNSYNENYNMHTPFVVTMGSIIKGDNNSNFEVVNGKVASTGSKNIVIGVSAPGLYSDIGLAELKDMDKIVISYETTKFDYSDIYFVLTPKMLENADLDIFNKLDNLSNSMNTLQSGMDKLVDGANQLHDGSNSLEEGATKLTNGIYTALEGAKKLEAGSISVDSSLNQIIAGLKQSENTLQSKANSLGGQLENINTLKNNNTATISKLTSANEQIYNGVKTSTAPLGGLDVSSDSFKTTIDNVHSSNLLDDNTYQLLLTYKTQYDANKNLINLLTYNNSALEQTVSALNSSMTEVSTNLSELETYLISLETEGTSVIKSGNFTLREGLEELYNGSLELRDGTKVLANGTLSLKEGLNKINNEGISQLTTVSKDASYYSNKVKQLTKLSKEYKGYSSNNADDVIFIYKVSK